MVDDEFAHKTRCPSCQEIFLFNKEWQTKDLYCALEDYILKKSGENYKLFFIDKKSKKDRDMGELPHGELNLISNCKSCGFIKMKIIFKDGILDKIIGPEIENLK